MVKDAPDGYVKNPYASLRCIHPRPSPGQATCGVHKSVRLVPLYLRALPLKFLQSRWFLNFL